MTERVLFAPGGSSEDKQDAQIALEDFETFEADHRTLTPSTDTTVTLDAATRIVRIKNWDTANRLLVKDGTIASDTDATASRVGVAPVADVPLTDWFPIRTASIHLRSAGASEVTIEAYR